MGLCRGMHGEGGRSLLEYARFSGKVTHVSG